MHSRGPLDCQGRFPARLQAAPARHVSQCGTGAPCRRRAAAAHAGGAARAPAYRSRDLLASSWLPAPAGRAAPRRALTRGFTPRCPDAVAPSGAPDSRRAHCLALRWMHATAAVKRTSTVAAITLRCSSSATSCLLGIAESRRRPAHGHLVGNSDRCRRLSPSVI